jgi:hypothetical protein
MASQSQSPGLDRIQDALDAADVAAARRALLELSDPDLELLSAEIGEEAVTRARRAAARGGRRAKLGRVLVLPGVMGSTLDVVDRGGEADRVWVSFVRLISGRLADLELTPGGDPAVPGTSVRPAGLDRRAYLPLLVELDRRWEVRPFAYDWRESLERTAARLDGEIRAFGGGGPVHLVAHSMGGLVARTFAALSPETWAGMDDPGGRRRGGRLVMLGTPNRGSFDVARALVGADRMVRRLALADAAHDLGEVLAIIATFPGLAAMLPSPAISIPGSAHADLYAEASWGRHPVGQALLDAARASHERLEAVIDAERLVYVAGHDRPTPFGVRIEEPGRLAFQETLDGDGRVPHALGLLGGVDTYWAGAAHGDLARSDGVLDAIDDLLQRGATDRLPKERPARPAAARRATTRAGRGPPGEAAGDAQVKAIAEAARARGGRPSLGAEETVRLENLVFGDDGDGATATPEAEEAWRPEPARVVTLPVEVVWGDLTLVDADVFVVGHYIGVLPQNAELAVDRVVSGVPRATPNREIDRSALVITQQTRRGMLRGALGEISLFPWGYPEERERLVAVAGMGYPGTYSLQSQRRLIQTLIFAVGGLPAVKEIATVLVGSGEGTLSIAEAVRGMCEGIEDAIADPAMGYLPIRSLVIAELHLERAVQIHAQLRAAAAAMEEGGDAGAGPVRVRLEVGREMGVSPGGRVSSEEALAQLIDAGLRAARAPESPAGRALEEIVKRVPAAKGVRKGVQDALDWEATRQPATASPLTRLPRFRVEERRDEAAGEMAVRLSFRQEDQSVRVAAIHQAATVPERAIRVRPAMITDLVERLTDPPDDRVARLSEFLARLLVPRDFREALRSGPFVFELDREMARVPWEMLAYDPGTAAGDEPLAVREPLARQLRTLYSPPPLAPARPPGEMRALVIGDPGDPAAGDDLPGARQEALAVTGLLRERLGEGNVDALIGAPSVPRTGRLQGIPAADWIDVLDLLMRGGYDLVHYAGHGDFDEQDARRAGWLFAGGLITSGEIERLEAVPTIIVANACLSARAARSETELLPGLADEFFKLGVRNYVGTAWEVNDLGAERFARTFYGALLPEPGRPGTSFGEAVRLARRELWLEKSTFGSLWAAYQHYGDPTGEAVLAPAV